MRLKANAYFAGISLLNDELRCFHHMLPLYQCKNTHYLSIVYNAAHLQEWLLTRLSFEDIKIHSTTNFIPCYVSELSELPIAYFMFQPSQSTTC